MFGERPFEAALRSLGEHGRGAGAGVLHIDARFAVEVERLIVGKDDILDLVVVERGEDDGAHAHLFGDLLLIFEGRVLLVDDGIRLFDAAIQNVFEPDHLALAGGHGAVFQRDHAVGDVHKVLRPLLAHEFEHLEDLFEVQILLIGDDVEAFIEVVRLFAVDGGGEVARRIEGSAVRAQNEAGRHAVGFEVDDLCAVALLQEPLFFEFFDDGRHLVGIKALARVRIEGDVQLFVDALDVAERQRLEPIEELVRLFVAALDEAEVFARFRFHRLVRLLVEADVEIVDGVDAALFRFLAAAPALVGGDELAELGAVVAQMIDAHRVIAEELEDAVERPADDRRREMPDVEGLGDVDGGIVDADGLARAEIGGAVLFPLLKDAGEDVFREPRPCDAEVDIAVEGFGFRDDAV